MSNHEYVPAVYPWSTNAELIYDCWKLGYVRGVVYDATPGKTSLWTRLLFESDERGETQPDKPLPGVAEVVYNTEHDFRSLPHPDNWINTVLYDPPYKLSGTPAMAKMDERYGISIPMNEADRIQIMVDGLRECLRIVREGGFVLAKCQDQVCSGRMVWQTDMLTLEARSLAHKVDRFDMIGHWVPQPKGRTQKHAWGRGSTLLVFRKR